MQGAYHEWSLRLIQFIVRPNTCFVDYIYVKGIGLDALAGTEINSNPNVSLDILMLSASWIREAAVYGV